MVWTAVQTVITIFVMIGAGIFISWKKWATAEAAAFLPKVIINVALPCMIIYFFSEKLICRGSRYIPDWKTRCGCLAHTGDKTRRF